MKKLALLLAGATALAFTSGAQAADMSPVYKAPVDIVPPVSGYLGLAIGASWADWRSYNDNAFIFSGEARVNVWLNPMWSVQLDVEGEGTTRYKSISGDGRALATTGVHVSYRTPQYLIGVVGALSAANSVDYWGGYALGLIGLEGQYYMGPWTFYLQGGWLGSLSRTGYEPNSMGFIRLQGRYYMTPYDRFMAEIGYAGGTLNDFYGGYTGRARAYNFMLQYAHRFMGTPWSFTAQYDWGWGSDSHFGHQAETNEHIFRVGLQVDLVNPDIYKRDHNGPALDMPSGLLRTLQFSCQWTYCF